MPWLIKIVTAKKMADAGVGGTLLFILGRNKNSRSESKRNFMFQRESLCCPTLRANEITVIRCGHETALSVDD